MFGLFHGLYYLLLFSSEHVLLSRRSKQTDESYNNDKNYSGSQCDLPGSAVAIGETYSVKPRTRPKSYKPICCWHCVPATTSKTLKVQRRPVRHRIFAFVSLCSVSGRCDMGDVSETIT